MEFTAGNQKTYSGRNEEQTEVRECLLPFGTESFVFHFDIQKFKIKINRITILPLVLYGCETWSLTMREERKLGVFGNRVLRKIFGSKKENILPQSAWREMTRYFHLVVQTSCDRFRKV
jgi:hypothetical protein